MSNILDTIQNIRDLSIFSTAIKITSLDKILDDRCEYTIFAPNNLAFAQLSKVNLNILTEDIWLLTEILSIHMISGKFSCQTLLKMCPQGEREVSLTSIDSSPVSVNLMDGIKIDNSTVLSTDVSASNGIIHLIDRVMMPTSQKTLP
jgi:uncharacterized surface protein with fasciclin (FAS1) repeats